jgi:hypothetical protein
MSSMLAYITKNYLGNMPKAIFQTRPNRQSYIFQHKNPMSILSYMPVVFSSIFVASARESLPVIFRNAFRCAQGFLPRTSSAKSTCCRTCAKSRPILFPATSGQIRQKASDRFARHRRPARQNIFFPLKIRRKNFTVSCAFGYRAAHALRPGSA